MVNMIIIVLIIIRIRAIRRRRVLALTSVVGPEEVLF